MFKNCSEKHCRDAVYIFFWICKRCYTECFFGIKIKVNTYLCERPAGARARTTSFTILYIPVDIFTLK